MASVKIIAKGAPIPDAGVSLVPSTKNDQIVYRDIHMDIEKKKTIGDGKNPRYSGDIRDDVDDEAIKNSIRNIFTTRKGEKLLSPLFGVSLEEYLFEPITPIRAKLIGDDILKGIESFEPRVIVEKVSVQPFPDQNEYKIFLSYTYSLNRKQGTLVFIIDRTGQIRI